MEHLAEAGRPSLSWPCVEVLQRRKMKRSEAREEKEIALKAFLRAHRFGSDVNAPRAVGRCLPLGRAPEVLWPLHVAAQQGDAQVVRLLLARGADPEQKSSRQRTAHEIAEASRRSRKKMNIYNHIY